MAEDMKVLAQPELKKVADQMIHEGTMPAMEEVVQIISEMRDKYRKPILDARQQKEKMPKPTPGALTPLG